MNTIEQDWALVCDQAVIDCGQPKRGFETLRSNVLQRKTESETQNDYVDNTALYVALWSMRFDHKWSVKRIAQLTGASCTSIYRMCSHYENIKWGGFENRELANQVKIDVRESRTEFEDKWGLAIGIAESVYGKPIEYKNVGYRKSTAYYCALWIMNMVWNYDVSQMAKLLRQRKLLLAMKIRKFHFNLHDTHKQLIENMIAKKLVQV